MKYILNVIIVILLIGCSSDTIEPEKTIETDVIVTAVNDNNNIYIFAYTVEYYNCLTYHIDYSLEMFNDIIVIQFNEILEPEGCFYAFGPAQAQIYLGELEEGEYRMLFKLNGLTTYGTLLVNSKPRIVISSSPNIFVTDKFL